jgi:ubiquinone/menaquinone biosynthesis C-methylase UbiE
MGLNKYIAKQMSDPVGVGGRIVSFFMNRQNRPLYDKTLKHLALKNTDNVLDIGCGNGYVMSLFAKQCNCMFTGVDISRDIIRVAIQRNRKMIRAGRFSFFNHSADSMNFDSKRFDKIYSINTVYFWENLDKTMQEIYRVLKPDGLFVNTIFTNATLSKFSHTRYGYKRYEVEQLVRAGRDIGFIVSVISILDNSAYCIIYHKPKVKQKNKP